MPDVVTLDVEMPKMDGLTALRHLMQRYPRPVVMLSSLTQAGAITTLRALHLGAVDFVAKPSGAVSLDFYRVKVELIEKIRAAAQASLSSLLRGSKATPEGVTSAARLRRAPQPQVKQAAERLVVIGSSTGGPRALATVVPALRPQPGVAYLVVQHMPAGFTRSLAERLDGESELHVREAQAGDRLEPGTVLVAPGDFHLRVKPGGTIDLDHEARVHGVRPSVDCTLLSAAQVFGSRTVVAILTGMGRDGADGALAIRKAGGTVVAEDESTCVVYGMPRAAFEVGAAQRMVPLNDIPAAIAAALGERVHA